MKYYIIGAVMAIAIAIAVIINALKKSQYQKILNCIQQGDHSGFENLCKSGLTKFLFPEMYIDHLRLDEAMIRNNRSDIELCLQRLSKATLSEKDREKVYSQAYNYYLSCCDEENCRKWLNKIESLQNDRLIQETRRTFDIYIQKGDRYLDEMLEETSEMEPPRAYVNEYLISMMYRNRNDKINARKYEALAKQHLEELNKIISKK